MSSDKGTAQLGFRIKWGDKEIEYFGDASKDVLRTILDYVKSSPDAGTLKDMPIIIKKRNNDEPFNADLNSDAEFEGYTKILRDTGVSIEKLTKTIIFQKNPEFENYIPMLPSHPPQRQAVRLVTYALQVGLEQPQIRLRQLKKILELNHYSFPGSALGSILVDFRRSGFASADSANQHRNRPLSLTETGLEMARNYIRKF